MLLVVLPPEPEASCWVELVVHGCWCNGLRLSASFLAFSHSWRVSRRTGDCKVDGLQDSLAVEQYELAAELLRFLIPPQEASVLMASADLATPRQRLSIRTQCASEQQPKAQVGRT